MLNKQWQTSFPQHFDATLIEVIDAHNQPLAYLDWSLVLKQQLRYQKVIAMLFTHTGHLILRKQLYPQTQQYIWGVATGPVLAGEAKEDAAMRMLQEHFTYMPEKFYHCQHLSVEQTNAAYTLTIFHAKLPCSAHRSFFTPPENYLFVDADELTGLVASAAELLCPDMVWIAQQEYVYSASQNF